MSDTATDLTPPPTDTPPPEPEQQTAQAQGDGDPTPLQIEDDAAVDAALQQSTIPVPDGGELVDGRKAGEIARAYRGKIKELKGELESLKPTAAKAEQLEQQIAALNAKVNELQPYVAAYQQMTQAAQQIAEPSEADAEAEAYAKDLDLFTQEGKPDIVRAKRILATVERLATKRVEAAVGPLHQQTAAERSGANLARAAATTIGNIKADPNILRAVWSRLDPAVTATPEGAQHALIQAIGFTVAQQAQQGNQQPQAPRTPSGQFAKADVPAPMFTEKAGGKDSPASDSPLSPQEQSYIKSMGISEKDYRESARSAPWLRR